jgi:hypothetical protein
MHGERIKIPQEYSLSFVVFSELHQSYIILLPLPHSDGFPKASFKQLRMRVNRMIDVVFQEC